MPSVALLLWVIIYPDMRSVSDSDQYRSSPHLVLSYMQSFISWCADVSSNELYDDGLVLIFDSVYCNSLLATLNVRNAIRGKGHGSLGISLYPVNDSNSSTTGNHKVDGLVCLLFCVVAHPTIGIGNQRQSRNRGRRNPWAYHRCRGPW